MASIAAALSQAGDALPSRWLNEALGWPTTFQALLDGLLMLSKRGHKHALRGDRLATLCDHLTNKQPSLAGIPYETQVVAAAKWSTIGVSAAASSAAAGAQQKSTASTQSNTRVGTTPSFPPASSGAVVLALAATDTSALTVIAPPVPVALPSAVVPASATPPSAVHKGKVKKQALPADVIFFSDLRMKWKPVNPKDRQDEFVNLQLSPLSPAGTSVFKFEPTARADDRGQALKFGQSCPRSGTLCANITWALALRTTPMHGQGMAPRVNTSCSRNRRVLS